MEFSECNFYILKILCGMKRGDSEISIRRGEIWRKYFNCFRSEFVGGF